MARSEVGEFPRANPSIAVDAKAMGSGEGGTAIESGSVKAHVFSPASSAYLALLDGKTPPKTEPLVLSPLVIATWKPTAEALGWPRSSLAWSDFLNVATDA